jgi:short-subunit dehydrogenase
MRRTLADARVLLTGASSGIGRELALALARRGARLLLSARRGELLASLAEECRQLGAQAEFLAGDVADGGFRAALIDRAGISLSDLDVLVNNAGVSAHGKFAGSDGSTLRRIMEVNFFAPAELTRLALPLLRKGRKPAIVNIGSILGHRGVPFNGEYVASKFALRGWTESLRAELAGDGIDVLLVSPGTTETEFFDHLIAKQGELPWGKSRAIPAAEVAAQTICALERGRREIFPNWRGHALVLANRFFPRVVDLAMTRWSRPK